MNQHEHPSTPVTHPRISVLMPVYNGEKHLAAAIDSILAQTFREFEFIIAVDRESADRSLEIVDRYASQDTRIIRRLVPRSRIGGNLNYVIPQARGTYIALMEADDLALPNRLQLQFEWMETNPVDICGGAQKLFGGQENLRWFPETHEGIRAELLFSCALHPSCVMMKAEVLQNNLFDPAAYFQDYEYWTRIIHRHQAANMPHIVARVRIHDQQNSAVNEQIIAREQERYGRRHFYQCFPAASDLDYQAYRQVAESRPCATIAQLAAAGRLLVQCGDVPENALRGRMAARWYQTCLRSAALGPEAYTIFTRFAARFGAADSNAWQTLQAACQAGKGAG